MKNEVTVKRGVTLLDAVREAEIPLETTCGGEGKCGKCKVIVNKGEARPTSEMYKKYLSKKELDEGYVLACDTRVLGDLYVSVPVESRREKTKILAESSVPLSEIAPSVRKYGIGASACSSEENLQKELTKLCGFSPKLNYGSYKAILGSGHDVTVTVGETKQPEVIGVEAGNRVDRNYGLAVDVGTTTIVAELVDLNTGKVLSRGSTLNKQITFGEALLSRVKHSGTPQGLKQLQEAVVGSINEVVEKILAESSVERENVYEVCVGGNTVMNHLLTGKKADHFNDSKAKIPTEPIISTARELGININHGAGVYCLPNVSRWLGGDVTGDVLASGLHKSKDISMLIDMGTNGEIVLGCSDWSVSCTVPSGPAFEGGGLKFGMRGQKGGIEHANIDKQSFVAKYRTIEDAKPRGICGSGAIDLLAEMYSTGLIDFCGNLQKGNYLFSWDDVAGNGNMGLAEYLTGKLGTGQIKIEKIDNDKTIRASTGKNSLLLRLNDEKTKVNVEIYDGRTDEFMAIAEKDRLNVYQGKTPRIRTGDDGKLEYIVAPAGETELGRDITLPQGDINYVIDSKATVQGGIKALLKKVGISAGDVKNLYLAGAFGNYMDLEKSRTTGLLPEMPGAKTYLIGNGSLGGAYLALVSKNARKAAEGAVKKNAYFDLSADSDFLDAYMASLYIPGNDIKS